MSQAASLVKTLKRELKAQGMTYADVAQGLGLSESSIKRMFADSRLSLDRLDALCQLLGLEFADLAHKMSESRTRIDRLTEEQERQVASDPKLLLVAISALNHWSFEEIIASYDLSEHECIQLAAKLDRLKLIELLPGNRFRLTVSNDFRWIPNGPIQQFFRREVQPDFIKSNFSGPGEKMVFRSGMLSRGANALLMKKIERLIAEFNELHDEDTSLPLTERYGTSLLVAMRPWELSHFRELKRNPDEKNF